jgi:hypothetical protein
MMLYRRRIEQTLQVVTHLDFKRVEIRTIDTNLKLNEKRHAPEMIFYRQKCSLSFWLLMHIL